MVQWKNRVKIGDLHQAFCEETITVSELALKVYNRLKNLSYYKDESEHEFQKIVDSLNDVADYAVCGEADIDDYDSCLSALYDWADHNHRLWIDTTA